MSGVESDRTVPAAAWLQAQASALLAQRGHAWLLQGPSGLGQYDLALALARAWLCEAAVEGGAACGTCASCHAIDVRTHADLAVLMPETDMLSLNWPLGEKAQGEIDDKKRKPSREIRIEAMRDVVEFAQRTSARGRAKVVLVFPAESMNAITANALLKTLEEPAGDVRFVLASEAAHLLLPTIRSRCLVHAMAWPPASEALAWLEGHGLSPDDARFWLRASGGRPSDALVLAGRGLSTDGWSGFPAAMARGDTAWVAQWGAADLVDAMQRLCHDLMASGCAAQPRFFEVADLPKRAVSIGALAGWTRELARTRRTVEHPFNAGLLTEALVSRARIVLNSPT